MSGHLSAPDGASFEFVWLWWVCATWHNALATGTVKLS